MKQIKSLGRNICFMLKQKNVFHLESGNNYVSGVDIFNHASKSFILGINHKKKAEQETAVVLLQSSFSQ